MAHRPLRRPSFQLASHTRKSNLKTQRGCDGNTAGILNTDYLVNRLVANSILPFPVCGLFRTKLYDPCHIHKNTQLKPTRPATMLHMIHRCIHHEITHSHTPSHYYVLLHFFEDLIRRQNFHHNPCVKG
jgi:hypothetical protein